MTDAKSDDKCTSYLIQTILTPTKTPVTPSQRAGTHISSARQPGSSDARGVDALGVTAITALSIFILSRFNKYGLSNLLEEFPTCDTSVADCTPALLPHTFQPLVSCELLIFWLFILTSLHWYRVLSLFGSGSWKEKHRGPVLTVTLAGILCCAMFVNDQTAVFLVITPLVVDLAMVSCLVVDWITALEI